jgi:molybdate transport system substrate-binding protein
VTRPARLLAILRFALLLLPLVQAETALAQSTTITSQPLMVFAAASLKNALDEIGRDWTAQGHAPVSMTYAASSTLAQQIMADAPADLFLSADLDWMDWLAARGKIKPDQRRILLGNRLVLITQARNPVSVSFETKNQLVDALGQGRLALADPRVVPAGKYGKAALESLGLWEQLAAKIVPADHVRAVVTFVARGEAPFGIVYHSDVKADPAIRQVAVFPDASHPPIRYPAAVISRSTHQEAAEFLAYLESPRAQARFVAEGFLVPPVTEAKP